MTTGFGSLFVIPNHVLNLIQDHRFRDLGFKNLGLKPRPVAGFFTSSHISLGVLSIDGYED